MQTNVQIDSKNLRGNDDNFRPRNHHITIEELVAISPERRNWRGIFIALLVIAAVFSLILFSIYLLTPENEGPSLHGRHISLNDILSERFLEWKPFNGTWISDFEIIFRDPTGGLSILNLRNKTTTTFIDNSIFRQLNAEAFIVSPDQNYVLLISDKNNQDANYHIHDVQTANTITLGSSEALVKPQRLQYAKWAPITRLTSFRNESLHLSSYNSSSAEARRTNHERESINLYDNNNNKFSDLYNQPIAFVYRNDIYYKPKALGNSIQRITTTGSPGIIYHGIPDWTYANAPELNSHRNSLVFSPDGLYLAFLTYNDSEVSEYKYTVTNDETKYPAVNTQRYPKAGSQIPEVTLSIVNLDSLNNYQLSEVHVPTQFVNGSYLSGLSWPSSRVLSVMVSNREQNQQETFTCEAPEFNCYAVHSETSFESPVLIGDETLFLQNSPISKVQSNNNNNNNNKINDNNVNNNNNNNNNSSSNYVDNNNDNNKFTNASAKATYFLKRLPVRDGEHGYFRHIVFISSIDRRPIPLTMGRYEVTEILGWDAKNEFIYFMAAPERRPSERHLYRIELKLNITRSNRVYTASSQPVCLTCNEIETDFVPKESFHEWIHEFNNNETENEDPDSDSEFKYGTPYKCLYNKISFSFDYTYYIQECLDTPGIYVVDTETNLKILPLNQGEGLKEQLSQLALPQIRKLSVQIRYGVHAQVRLFLPPDMNDEEEMVFPLILQIDASPGSQLVNDRFAVDWNWYLCSQRSFIVAQIDGRGSGYQGESFRNQVKGRLGTVEIEDQLTVLSHLRENFKFIDPSRICAYGWGYGGYAAILALSDDSQQILQCVVAVNPVVSFGYHYATFTERYFRMKSGFSRALQQSDLTTKIDNLRGRHLLLVHGTADTFVHHEHTLMLVRALVDQQIKFRQQVYPNEDHKLSRSLVHLYKTMEWYFDECFGPNEDTDWDPTALFVFKQ